MADRFWIGAASDSNINNEANWSPAGTPEPTSEQPWWRRMLCAVGLHRWHYGLIITTNPAFVKCHHCNERKYYK